MSLVVLNFRRSGRSGSAVLTAPCSGLSNFLRVAAAIIFEGLVRHARNEPLGFY